MLKKYVVLSTFVLTSLVLATSDSHAKRACPVLSVQEKIEAYNELLPDLLMVATDRVTALEQEIKAIPDANTFAAEFAMNWLFVISHTVKDSEGVRPDLHNSLSDLKNRFKALGCHNASSECSEDFNHQRFSEVSVQMFPAVLSNLQMRIDVLKKFVKTHPKHKAVAVKNATIWAGFIESHIQRLKTLDQKYFAAHIKKLEHMLKEFKRLMTCSI